MTTSKRENIFLAFALAGAAVGGTLGTTAILDHGLVEGVKLSAEIGGPCGMLLGAVANKGADIRTRSKQTLLGAAFGAAAGAAGFLTTVAAVAGAAIGGAIGYPVQSFINQLGGSHPGDTLTPG